MSDIKIFHNPRCKKSRETLKLVEENVSKDHIEIVKYLETPPSEAELKSILSMLGISPNELVRKGEKAWKEEFKGKDLSDEELIKVMVKNPKLIERPIVIAHGKAVLGRPPENVLVLL
ncbi:arsenate reductase (glutaredoxin) [Echinicola jeungdonensis]|uniref:Arsenate reductase (Glutaredoxin) n=1 Tax=Echinicola jeungdonensis TaxID=709343 RepID=A0ABV5J8R9_9BACT|nr:arsenate reductase (glutaredoxin) [Echinicola jeungdonensis]MDN3670281.1 arsenate reductase (glutaredoxin) [Echinicola jeungdonensis]